MSANHGRRGRTWRRLREQYRAARLQPCGICQGAEGPIDYEAGAGSPLAFELDHITPLAHDRAGAEDPSNVRPVHAICNRRRGTGEHVAPMVADTSPASHSYSPTARGITTRDWSDDWQDNAWHRDNPGRPCPCRPAVIAGDPVTTATPPGTRVVASAGSPGSGYAEGSTGTVDDHPSAYPHLLRIHLDDGPTIDADPWRWATITP